MAERHFRCRFYPNCMIHTGDVRPLRLSPENRREIKDLYWTEHWTPTEIARVFEVRRETVSNIVTPKRKARP